MKKIFVILFSIVLISACSHPKHKEGNLIVKGKIKGLKLGTLLFKKLKNDTLVAIDSIKVDGNEQFEFVTNIKEPQMMLLELPEIKDGSIVFFAAPNDTVKIFTFLETFGINPQIQAGENQEKRNEYQEMIKKFNEKNIDLFKAKFEATKIHLTSKADSLEGVLQRLKKKRVFYTLNFVFTNKNKAIAPYVAMMEFYNNQKALDTIYKILPEVQKNSIYGKEIKKLLQN